VCQPGLGATPAGEADETADDRAGCERAEVLDAPDAPQRASRRTEAAQQLELTPPPDGTDERTEHEAGGGDCDGERGDEAEGVRDPRQRPR